MKRIKDPIYGYIELPDNVIENIIDTATFQRLRSIIQTSYSPLYASAVHNRFVHSLGVYYLGGIVSESFLKSAEEIDDIGREYVTPYIRAFKLACLLHDVGHAPFSHTGEDFYLDVNASRDRLHNQIRELTNDNALQEEISLNHYAAAPHELMSVVVALKSFGHLFSNDDEKSFFARSIIGYQYTIEVDVKKSFLNCMISMLNSSVIDVDKLDYLIRDAFITGFDTVSIDYVRLLRSVMVYFDGDKCRLVYSKAAISVIENVVFAHDSERKWIQNHPVVLYDMFLLKHSLEKLNDLYQVFNYDALTQTGVELSTSGLKVSLLNDGDITFLMKNTSDPFVNEYYSRCNRRHPLWKSEAEYKAVFNKVFNDTTFKTVENEFDELIKYLNYTTSSTIITDATIAFVEKDISLTEQSLSKDQEEKKVIKQLATKKKHLRWLVSLKNFAEDQGLEFDFVIVKANQFNSGFSKLAFENIEIFFSSLGSPCNFKKVTNALSAEKSERDKFFYLFVRRTEKNQKIEMHKLVLELNRLATEEAFS